MVPGKKKSVPRINSPIDICNWCINLRLLFFFDTFEPFLSTNWFDTIVNVPNVIDGWAGENCGDFTILIFLGILLSGWLISAQLLLLLYSEQKWSKFYHDDKKSIEKFKQIENHSTCLPWPLTYNETELGFLCDGYIESMYDLSITKPFQHFLLTHFHLDIKSFT